MYNSFISLGWFCGTASSMQRYGLRSTSSPFDWYFSNNFQSIIHFIESDFEDFLCKDNLQVINDKPNEFTDVKYDCYFNHEIKTDFTSDYAKIYNKYYRRIEKFREEIHLGTCFLRSVRDQIELEYITSHESYIQKVIKQSNCDNDIIFLIPRFLDIPSGFSFKYYELNIDQYRGDEYNLPRLFDTCKAFICYCKENISPVSVRDNLTFVLDSMFDRYASLESRHALLIKILKADYDSLTLPPRISIYGAGDNGLLFYDRIKEKCSVDCFIDANPKMAAYDSIQIISPDNCKLSANQKVIVIPIWAFEQISNTLQFTCNANPSNIISLDSIL